ncbi:unnamed protein product [Leuciscus chuanchicus]
MATGMPEEGQICHRRLCQGAGNQENGSFWLLSTDLASLIGCVLVLKVIQTVLLFHSREHIKHWKESLPAPVVTDMLTSLAKGICVSFPLALSLASAIDAASR